MNPWFETILRSFGLFVITLVLIRLMGKRHLVNLTPFQFTNYVVIALVVALILTKIITNLVIGFTTLVIWVGLFIALDYAMMKSKWLHDWVNGKETVLIKHGKVMEENLAQMRFTGEELLRSLRSKSVFNLSDVEFAVMETSGDVNVLLKADQQPLNPHDLGHKVAPKAESQTVIMDGNILDEPLANHGLNREWLNVELKKLGISLDNIFIGQVDSSGDLYVDLFDDSIQIPQPQIKEMLYATLEKSQADLVTFGLETQNLEAKEMYLRNAKKLDKLIQKLKPYLLH